MDFSKWPPGVRQGVIMPTRGNLMAMIMLEGYALPTGVCKVADQ